MSSFALGQNARDSLNGGAPAGFTVHICKIDLRPGGQFHYCLQTPDGQDVWGKWVFHKIISPHKIVFADSFSNEQGNPVRHPVNPDWPLETLLQLTLDEHKDHTKLVLRWTPLAASPKEQQAFEDAREMSLKGWAGTLDQLAQYLATRQLNA